MSDQQRDTLRRRILDWIDPLICGATCDEVEETLQLSHQTCSARITELLKSRHLVPYLYKGIWQRRFTRSLRKARVYTTKKGEA